LEELKQVT